MMRLLLGLPETGGYFSCPCGPADDGAALWSSVRSCGWRHQVRRSEGGLVRAPAKHAELRPYSRPYEEHLERAHRGDMALVYEEALAHPKCAHPAAGLLDELAIGEQERHGERSRARASRLVTLNMKFLTEGSDSRHAESRAPLWRPPRPPAEVRRPPRRCP